MSDGAKLQLLTRSTDESAFEIFEADSIAAYAGLKPQRPPADAYELRRQPLGIDGARRFVLKNLRRDCYLLLDLREHFLWQQFDGRNSLEEIARAFHLQYGAFDYNLIREFLAKLSQADLIENHQALAPQANFVHPHQRSSVPDRIKAAVAAWRRLTVRLPQADRYCSTLYRSGGFLLFHRASFWMILALALLGGAVCFHLAAQSADFARMLAARPYASTAVLLLAHLAALMLHVLAHALACKAHGRRVQELGFFLLQGVWPAFYADVTDIFMSDRRARLIVDLAGPLVEVCLGSLAMLAAYNATPGFEQALLFGIGVLLWESAWINLYPFSFLELDGYNMLADAIAMPMLRRQALALLPNLPARLRKPRTLTRAELVQTGYLVLCFISVLVYVVLHLDALAALFPFNRH
jgi:putative peptide zinc metalloprotease protein